MVGLIAGGGQYPLLFARAVKKAGQPLAVFALKGEERPNLRPWADVYYEIPVSRFGKLLALLKREKISEIALAGHINKSRAIKIARPDLKTLFLWGKLRNRNDDEILRAVAEEIEKLGIRVISPTKFLPELLTPAGVLTKKKPSPAQWKDIVYGFGIAKALGELDIGQCVVVKDQMVVAVEAIEGTDATIERAGTLVEDTVVIKVFKPQQDPRFDLPSAGLQTILTMKRARARVLALEARRSLFFEREKALSLADKLGIVVVGVPYE
ncbi:MAG TPA: LpxI family protein [Thermodesulfatator atlanticus]|uniref:LpxI family protein n=1 Tax=Thermodesulfatator atlanticus TaxID=501497 RepID=A0A7V5U1Z5_9BACT|nr:LpxI family protein [Thermodesulfatator atlanticus]